MSIGTRGRFFTGVGRIVTGLLLSLLHIGAVTADSRWVVDGQYPGYYLIGIYPTPESSAGDIESWMTKYPYPNRLWRTCNFTGTGSSRNWRGQNSSNGGQTWDSCSYYNNINIFQQSCPAGQVPTRNTIGGWICKVPVREKNLGSPGEGSCRGNPIHVGIGNKFQVEDDCLSGSPQGVRFQRHYNSMAINQTQTLAPGWRHSYNRSIAVSGTTAVAWRHDGKALSFQQNQSQWIAEPDIIDRLEKLFDGGGAHIGWRYTTAEDSQETYDSSGRLISIVARTGVTQTLTYSDASTPPAVAPAPGYLIGVTDSFGRSLAFTYSSVGQLTTMTDPGGGIVQYAYHTSGDVSSATYPGGRTRTYHYNESAHTAGAFLPHALTGVTDENSVRFATYKYDVTGRAVRSEHAGGAGQVIVTYNANGTSTVTDARGTASIYTFQTIQGTVKNTSKTQPAADCGPWQTTTYHATTGFPTARTDWNGNLTTYLRQDPNGRLDLETSRTEAVGGPQARTITNQWHSTFRLPTLITEPGRTTAFAYDSTGNILTKTVTDTATSSARTWTYTYNSIGQVLTVNGPRTDVSDVTTYAYDSATGNLLSVTNPAAHVTQITAYDGNGRPLTIVDPNALTTTLAYSLRGWLTSRTVGGVTTTYEYDFAGQLKKVTLPDSSYLEYVYDTAHRLTEIRDNLGNKIVYALDAMGNRTAENVRDPGSNLAQTRSRVYNSLNRLTQDIGGTSPSTQITTYGYDSQGNLTTVTDPLTHVTTNAYDALNRLISITNPLSGVTAFGLNSKDQLTSVTDPRSNATTYTVNALDDVTQQISPDTSTTANTYDAAGNVLTSTDAKSQVTTNTYDALNRITQATYHDNSKIEYGYDAGTYGNGHLTSLTEKDPAGTVVTTTGYAYDLHGRLLIDTRAIGGVNFVTSYGYDGSGRMNSLTYPSGLALAYSFDSAGRISQITATPSGGSPATVLSSVTYHPFGGAKGWTFGNSQTYSRTFDLDGRISGFTLGGTAMSVTFDAASRITGQTYFPVPANSVTYGYDNWDRLTSTVTPTVTYGFAYDANSNRTSKTVGGTTWTYAYPGGNNKLISITAGSAVTYTHDSNGSITNDGINTFTYDTRGRMTAAGTGLGSLTYNVNALGQRYTKTLSGTTTVYLYDRAGNLIAETSDGGSTYTEYLWLANIPVALLKPGSAALYYIHSDHLDTPRLIANQTPATVWKWDNDDPFGANMADANPSGLGAFAFNLRLPGQYFDVETNNHYNYYRDYSPDIGRYIESDPVGLSGGTNTYAYVNLNPIASGDLLGLETYMCTRRLSWVPLRAGPLYHQYVCTGTAENGFTCGGLGPTGNMFDSPGTVESDEMKPSKCQLVQPNNTCIEQCIQKKFKQPPPNYSVDLSHGENCQTYANSTVTSCVLSCKFANK